jgi:hypothetical protein
MPPSEDLEPARKALPRGAVKLASWPIVLWGVLGVVAVLVESAGRLGRVAVRLIREQGLTHLQLALLGGWLVAIGYAEGYRGFQQRFSPRTVARALCLAERPRPLHVALAPLFCMALFHTTRRRLYATWGLVAGIVALVMLVRRLPPIYRAIVDGGVACALAWGTLAMLVYLVRGLAGASMPISADLPEGAAAAPRAAGEVPVPGRGVVSGAGEPGAK